MPKRYRWIETSGGPHLLLPEELLEFWRGIEGWHDHADPSDKSDYARACRIRSWIGVIPCHTGNGLVLSGDAGPVAWIAGANKDRGVLVQWLGADDEASIGDALRSRELANALESPGAEEVEFSTGASGLLRLFDSAESGNHLESDSESVRLLPGAYRVRAGYFKTSSLMIVVRKIART